MSDSPYTTALGQTSGSAAAVETGNNGAGLHQQPLTDRLAQGAHHTIDRLAESAGPHLQRLEEAASGASVQLRNQARLARETGDEWAESLRSTVRRNPLAAVAIAMAIGALISRITR